MIRHLSIATRLAMLITLVASAVILFTSSGMAFDEVNTTFFGVAIKGWKTIEMGWDALNNYWNQWIIGYSYSRQKTILSKIGIEIGSWKGSAKAMFLAVSLAGLVILTVYFLAVYKRASRKQDAVQQIYTAFCTKLEKAGLPRSPAQGPQDYARMAGSARHDLAKQIQNIIDQYEE